jgi:aspartate aminotransferase, cytoplasmic
VGAEFLSRFLPSNVDRTVFVSDPTYVNHYPVFELSGFKVKEHPYYDAASRSLNFKAFRSFAENAPRNSVFLLHACAHNPTGVDPSHEQWDQLLPVFLDKGHVAFFDSAYQGFASGSPEYDAYSFRSWAAAGVPLLVAQSYAKNFGLYGMRSTCQ